MVFLKRLSNGARTIPCLFKATDYTFIGGGIQKIQQSIFSLRR